MATELDRARAILGAAKHVFVLTGAGMSAESGVPTFRGAGGLWRNFRAEDLATPEAFARDPKLVWTWYGERRAKVLGCAPHAGHVALAEFAKRKKTTLVTQNVDGLHERAGHPHVVRFHGSLFRNRCTKCGAERHDETSAFSEMPRSPCCDALERPGVVWFGEAIPREPLRRAEEAVRTCDAMLVVGTSGVVWPAAGYVGEAKSRGARVIEINPAPSGLPADVVLASGAAATLPSILVY